MDVLEQVADMKRAVMGHLTRADGDDPRTMTFRATTEAKARDEGILIAKGANFDNFDRNPAMLWRHGWSDVPNIGHVVDRKLVDSGKAWDFTVRFYEEGVSELADQVYRVAQAGPIAMSIGFRVTKYRSLSDEDRTELGLNSWGWVGEEWELLEASIVPVGADPTAVKRSLGDDDAAWLATQNGPNGPRMSVATGLPDLDTTRNDGPTPVVATVGDQVGQTQDLAAAIRDLTAAVEANTETAEALRSVLGESSDDERGAVDAAGDETPEADEEADSKRAVIAEAFERFMEVMDS